MRWLIVALLVALVAAPRRAARPRVLGAEQPGRAMAEEDMEQAIRSVEKGDRHG